MSKKIKILIMFLLFLFMMNIIYPVLADTDYVYALGVTEEDIEESRKRWTWPELVNEFNYQSGRVQYGEDITLTDADLVRLLNYDVEKEDSTEYTDTADRAVYVPQAMKELNRRILDKENKKNSNDKNKDDSSESESTQKDKQEEMKKLVEQANEKYQEICDCNKKDEEKLKKLKKEYVDIVYKIKAVDTERKLQTSEEPYKFIHDQCALYENELGLNSTLNDGGVRSDGKVAVSNGVIYKQPNIVTGRGNVDGTLDDMISDADSFVSKGNQADSIEIDGLKKLSVRLYDILLEIGVGAAVLIGIILGIKFLLSGVEEKAEVQLSLIHI